MAAQALFSNFLNQTLEIIDKHYLESVHKLTMFASLTSITLRFRMAKGAAVLPLLFPYALLNAKSAFLFSPFT